MFYSKRTHGKGVLNLNGPKRSGSDRGIYRVDRTTHFRKCAPAGDSSGDLKIFVWVNSDNQQFGSSIVRIPVNSSAVGFWASFFKNTPL